MNEANIPIDIQSGKLQDWLVSRRHVKKDWQNLILPIREKINNAIQDMPAHEGIANLLSGTYINYFHCLKIVEILKETEADTKNLFGRYGSQRMKDWQEIIRLYEKDNIYLAEAANVLVRNINFEVPSLRKQIQKFEQTQNECDKKINEYIKKEQTSRNEFNTVCKQMGISGDRIKAELVEKLKELPDLYKKLGKNVSTLKSAVDYYRIFTKCIVNEETAKSALALLAFVAEKGNVTVYEWNYGEAPLSVEPSPVLINVEDDADNEKDELPPNEDVIVFDDVLTNEAIDFGDVQIDFGDDNNKEIDWGDINVDEKNETLENINFDLSLEESGIVIDNSGFMGGIAKGKEALTILDSPTMRAEFINQLLELESFLKMRFYELSIDSGAFSMLQDLPIESIESITTTLDSVQVILSEITEKKIEHLHNIKHSPRYVDTLTVQLKQKITMCNKMKEQIEIMKGKKEEAHKKVVEILPILNLIIEKSKELHIEIERDISKKYNGRPVNVTGGVKVL